ncbi:IreB family regulatory phosphoprotein [Terrisporobacter mayombei]
MLEGEKDARTVIRKCEREELLEEILKCYLSK